MCCLFFAAIKTDRGESPACLHYSCSSVLSGSSDALLSASGTSSSG